MKRRRLRLIYLTYQENILGSGILWTHVVRMLETLRSLDTEASITLLSFMSPQLLRRSRPGFRDLKKRLRDQRIELIMLPAIISFKWTFFAHLLILFWLIPVLGVIWSRRINLIHTRSYFAGMLGTMGGKLTGVPVIFDPRGEFPRELGFNKTWREGGITQTAWLRFERYMLRSAAAVIGVTPEYRDEFRRRGARRASFVPNRTDVEQFSHEAEVWRMEGQAQLPPLRPPLLRKGGSEAPSLLRRGGSENQRAECVLLYTGEMHSVSNSPEYVARNFVHLLGRYPEAKLRLFTTANVARAERVFTEAGIPRERVSFESSPPQELPRAIQGSTLALLFLALPIHSVWMVKMAEFLASGIPLIVDCSVPGLPREIIQRERLGVVVDPTRPDTYARVDEILSNWDAWSERCINYARRRLDLRSTARQHLRIYRQILRY